MLKKLFGAVVGLVLTGTVGTADAATLYGSAEGSLWTINVATGATTLIGNTPSTGATAVNMLGLAFDASGTLYGSAEGSLWTINVATGATTLIGNTPSTGATAVNMLGLDFSPLTPVPIPAALPLFAAGLGAMGFMGWRRRKAAVGG